MKKIKAIMAALFIATSAVTASAAPAPQYNSRDNTDGRIVRAYYLEDGKIQNIRIKVQHRYLKSYWNGREWVLRNAKIENNKLSETLKDDESDATKFLAKLPKSVMIETLRVYFDPDAE